MFNSFLNIYLRILNCSFPLRKVINKNGNGNNWITSGIKTSCRHKMEMYCINRYSNNLELKTFDSVNHVTLRSKLLYHGISRKAKLLHGTYLQNVYQTVHITKSYLNSNKVPKWTNIKYGVPQGSILGPLLFLVYSIDLPKAIESKALPILFADYTGILLTNPNNIHTQSDLNLVFEQLN